MKKVLSFLLLFTFFSANSQTTAPDSIKKADTTSVKVMISYSADTLFRSQFNQGIVSDPLQLISGKMAGAEIYKAGSDPNVTSVLSVRGMNSLYSDRKNLFIVDGVMCNDIFMIPPDEIESVIIEKDLAYTAYYGNEGSNGIVIITTKKGRKDEKIGVEFNNSLTLNQPTHLPDVFTAEDYRQHMINSGKPLSDLNGGSSTDWNDAMFNNTISQTYQIGLGGTIRNTNYRASFNHIADPGTLKNTGRNLTGGQIKVSQTGFKNTMKADAVFSWYNSESKLISYPAAENNSLFQNILYHTYTRNPTDAVFNPDGSYNRSHRVYDYNNPVAMADLNQNTRESGYIAGGLHLDWDLGGLGIKVSGDFSRKRDSSYYEESSLIYYYPRLKKTIDTTKRYDVFAGLTYKGLFSEKHHLSVLLGGYYRSSSSDITAIAEHAAGIKALVNYSFRNRYLLNLVLNQEHSDGEVNVIYADIRKTATHAEWIFYPGVSAAWIISNENFLKNSKLISHLLIRGSYGKSGEKPTPATYISSTYKADNYLATMLIDEFTGEAEASLFKNKISIDIRYFRRQTNNGYYYQNLPVPPNVSYLACTNGQGVRNTGFEAEIAALAGKNSFSWNPSLTFNYSRNKITSLDDPSMYILSNYLFPSLAHNSDYTLIMSEGNALAAFYLPVFVQYYEGQPVYVGQVQPYTNNIDAARRETVDNVFPVYHLAFTNAFRLYENLEFSFMLSYTGGYKIFNLNNLYLDSPEYYGNLNTREEAANNYDAGIEKLAFSTSALEDASYLRLENLYLGYTFRPKMKTREGTFTVYFASRNLFTISNYSGTDPAFNPASPGTEYFNVYPLSRTYTIGLRLGI